MNLMNGLFLLAAIQQPATPAPPPPPPSLHGGSQEMTCPVGGEKFSAFVTSMYSTYGERPDGRRYTYWSMPLPLAECPSNKLVVFSAFTDAEVARLARLIQSPQYRALIRNEDTTYYRAQWLATRIGRPETEALWLLLTATWQVKPAPGPVGQGFVSAKKAKAYNKEFVRRVRALPAAPGDKDYQALWYRAANAERELGSFAEAGDMLDALEGWLVKGAAGHALETVMGLKAVVARRDSAVDPVDMIDKQRAVIRCVDHPPEDAFSKAFCARPDMREEIERYAAMRRR